MSTGLTWVVPGGKLRAWFRPGLTIAESVTVSQMVRASCGLRGMFAALSAAARRFRQQVSVTPPRGKAGR